MVHPAGKQVFLTFELILILIYLGSSPRRISFKRGTCFSQLAAEIAIQLLPSFFCCYSSSAVLLATSYAKVLNDYISFWVQISKLGSFDPSEIDSAVTFSEFPRIRSVSQVKIGITALKQSTKEAQMKGTMYVKQVIWRFVFGVISPQPIVVAVTISLQRMIQSSGTVPSGSFNVHILYPSKTRPKNKYSTIVYLSKLINILRSLVKLFPVVANRSSSTSPNTLATQMILKKNRPTKKLQLLGMRLQVKKSEMTTCRTSKKCFLEMSKDRIVKPISKRTA